MSDEIIIGIDLGTTNSLAAWVPAVMPEVIPGRPRPIVPSVVSRKEGHWIVGDAALARRLTDPKNTLFSVKRLIGKDKSEVQDILNDLPYKVVEEDNKNLKIQTEGQLWSPEEVSAEILKALKQRAQEHLNREIKKAVITVPAYFDDVQRASTKLAGELAGLEVVRVINEPTAAALAYGMNDRDRGHIVVYDLGGGTFDVSVLSVENGILRVLSTAGDTLLGGDDFDNLIMKFLAQNIESDDPRFLQELRKIAEKGKKALSSNSAVDLEIQIDEQKISRRFTRDEFENSITNLVEKTIHCCQQALKDAQLEVDQINEVILVGGSTRIPFVQKKVEEFFGHKPHCELNPDEVVALGAAIQGHILSGKSREILLMDVTPLSLGLETIGGAMTKLIARNATIPTQARDEFTTYADNQTGLDLHILQGERELAQHNRSLGRFRLSGFPPMPAGIPKFVVVFALDANGLLKVEAHEERSGAKIEVSLTPNRGLSQDEVKKMKKEAVDHSKEDLQAVRAINICNEAQIVLQATRKAFDNVRGKLPEHVSKEQFSKMEEAANQLENYLNEKDVVMVEFAHEELNQLTEPLADNLIQSVVKEL